MKQVEWRRKKLLEYTRNLYSENRMIPAVHPRYKVMYQKLYDDGYEMKSGTFGIRVVICVVIFFIYVAMEYRDVTVLGLDTMQVIENIMQNSMLKLY